MLERIDAVLSSKMTTVITGAIFLAVVFHTTFDVPSWVHTSWCTILTCQAGL